MTTDTRGRVIVVGGGPAGSVAALLLARQGWSVELIEQQQFPRDKVCGECLSSVGLAALDRAGLTSRLKSLQPTVLVRTLIHTRDGPTLDIPLPRPMWGLTRFAMDRELMAAASEAGVVVRQPARCERLSGGRRPGLTWRDLRSNQVTHTGADWIVVADGKGSLLPPGAPPSTGDLGIKAHFGSVAGPRDAIELFAGPGCYGGLAAVEGNRWNAAFSVPVAMVRQCGGDVAAAFEHIVAFNPTLADRLRNAQRPTRWLAAPLPRFAVRQSWPERIVPVGNAAAALEPIGGEGMGLAIASAELAAEAIGKGTQTVRQLTKRYSALWRARRLACRTLARSVSTPALADAGTALFDGQQIFNRFAMRCIGKS